MKAKDREAGDYEVSYADRWSYLKHFKVLGGDMGFFLDVSCLEASTSDDACPVVTVDEQECTQAAVAVSPELLIDVTFHLPASGCDSTEEFTRIRGKDLMCCHSRF